MHSTNKRTFKRLLATLLLSVLVFSMMAVNVSAASWGRWQLKYSNSNTSTGDKNNNFDAWASYASGDLTSIRAACYGKGWGSENCTANSNMYVIIKLGQSEYIPTQVKTKVYSKAFISFSSTASGVSGYAQGEYELTK